MQRDAVIFTRALLRPYFRDVRRASLDVRDSALVMVCRRPAVIRKAQLAAALRFEFELKIDGKPLGRSDRAIAAFARLGLCWKSTR